MADLNNNITFVLMNHQYKIVNDNTIEKNIIQVLIKNLKK